ncbi:MAG: hypothetical protein GY906_39080 [bacterium]|nr:hypothetical protein [bacterium]
MTDPALCKHPGCIAYWVARVAGGGCFCGFHWRYAMEPEFRADIIKKVQVVKASGCAIESGDEELAVMLYDQARREESRDGKGR